jgi:hypothetical protein
MDLTTRHCLVADKLKCLAFASWDGSGQLWSIFPLSGYGNSQPIAVFDAAMLIGCFP